MEPVHICVNSKNESLVAVRRLECKGIAEVQCGWNRMSRGRWKEVKSERAGERLQAGPRTLAQREVGSSQKVLSRHGTGSDFLF